VGQAVERADHLARVVDVHLTLALDRGQATEPGYWARMLELVGLPAESRRQRAAAVEAAVLGQNPNSLRESVRAARRDAMAVRPSLSSEVYENLNALHRMVEVTESRTNFHDFSIGVQRGIALLHGLIDETMAHDEAWEFLQLGRQLLRAANVVRLVTRKLEWLADVDDPVEWAAVLRSCSAFEAYRWRFSTPVTPDGVARFLLLDRTLPRSARKAVSDALESVRRVDGPGDPSPPHRLLGRLSTLFEFTVADEVVADPRGFAQAYTNVATHLEDAFAGSYLRPTQLPTVHSVAAPPIWSSVTGRQQEQQQQ
jgi:uncharacterized alpha-E superfamily protein